MKFKTIALLFACIFSAQVMVAQSTLSGPPKKPKTTTQTSKPRSNSTSKPRKQKANSQSPKMSAPDGTINGFSYVDLGLPSGLKWATCNVGATSPEGFGDYFAWGETKTKSSYTTDNCPTNDKNNTWLRNNGYIDSSGNLTMSHDAARQNWGGTWRMPTVAEIDELVNNTTSQWTKRKGVSGRLVTSKHNGKSIFIPAAGCFDEASTFDVGDRGYCWSSTPCGFDNAVYGMIFLSDYFNRHRYYFYYGFSVRAVSE